MLVAPSLCGCGNNIYDALILCSVTRRYLSDYCSKVLHIAESFLHKAKVQAPVLLETQIGVSKQLEGIAEEHNMVIKRLKSCLEDKIKEIRKEFIYHLNSKAVKKAVSEWDKDEKPILDSGDTWYEFEAKTLEAVQGKLAVIVFRWEKEKKIIATAQGALLLVFDEKYGDLESKLKNTQLVIEGQAPTRATTLEAEEALEIDDLLEFTKDFHSLLLANSPTRFTMTSGVSPIMLPFIFIRDLFKGLFNITSKTTVEQQHLKTMASYKKKPEKFMQETMLQVIKSIQSSETLDAFIRNRLEGASKKIEEIESAIPSALQDETDLMESLKRDDRSKTMINRWVWPVANFFKEKVNMLKDFGTVYTNSTDYDEDDISNEGEGACWKGIWANYSIAKLNTFPTNSVCIKTNTDRGSGSISDELEILRYDLN